MVTNRIPNSACRTLAVPFHVKRKHSNVTPAGESHSRPHCWPPRLRSARTGLASHQVEPIADELTPPIMARRTLDDRRTGSRAQPADGRRRAAIGILHPTFTQHDHPTAPAEEHPRGGPASPHNWRCVPYGRRTWFVGDQGTQ